MKGKYLVIIFILLALAGTKAASAATCPTDDGEGTICSGETLYWCGAVSGTGSCVGESTPPGFSQCTDYTGQCVQSGGCANCATIDCGYCAICSSGYSSCGVWPNRTCVVTVGPVSPCSNYDSCNGYCTGCIPGYTLCMDSGDPDYRTCQENTCAPGQTFNACTQTCTGFAGLKLGSDSVSGTNVIQSPSLSKLYIPTSGLVGIGTTAPSSLLHVAPTSGTYSILAGDTVLTPYRIGNADDPIESNDVATKFYVDNSGGSGSEFWDGEVTGNIWNLNSGNVGIGTTGPGLKTHIAGSLGFPATSGSVQTGVFRLQGLGSNGVLDFSVNGGSGASLQVTNQLALESVYSLLLNPNGGNVGIGTTGPAVKLQVTGTTGGDGTWNQGILIENTNATVGETAISFKNISSGSNYWFLGQNQDADFHINYGTSFGDINNKLYITTGGNVGIGTTGPGALLHVAPSSGNYSILAASLAAAPYRIGNLDDPVLDTDAATKYYVDYLLSGGDPGGPIEGAYLPLIGGDMKGDINMEEIITLDPLVTEKHNITGVNELSVYKLSADVIDPLYTLNGANYATFVASIVGGVKEEYVGKIKIRKAVMTPEGREYEAMIDFAAAEEGSELWVWYQVVDFGKDKVEALITPYGKFANTYYFIDGERLVFRADRPVEISYRLIGKRFDWRDWPLKPFDQSGKGMEVKLIK